MTPDRTSTREHAEPATVRSLLTPAGREARPFRTRVTASFAVIAALHLIGLGLLATEYEWAARLLRWAKGHLQRWTAWVARQPLWLRITLGAVALLAVAAAVAIVTLT